MRKTINLFLIVCFVFSLVGCASGENPKPVTSTNTPESSTANTDQNPLKIVGQIGGPTNAVAVQGNVAFVGVGYRLMILDVTDPSHPQEIGASQPLKSQIQGITVQGEVAYLATGESGLSIINIADPAQPALVGQYDTIGFAEGILVDQDHAFVADGPGGMSILNIGNPANPTLVSETFSKNYIYDIVLDQSHAYLASAGAGLLVADVSDRTNPVELGNYDTSGYAYGLTMIGSTLYIADGWEGLQVLDVSDPGNPEVKNTIQTPGWAMDLTILNDSLYVADAFGGLCVLDISNAEAPDLVGSLKIPEGHAVQVALSGNVLFMADIRSGVHMIDVSNQDQPAMISSYNPMGSVQAVTVADGYAYAAALNSGFRVINVKDPAQPREVATIPLLGPAVSIAHSGTTTYVADYEFLNTVDVSDPLSPKVTSSERMQGKKNTETLNSESFLSDEVVYLVSRSLTIQGTSLFLAGEWGLLLLDIADPLSPRELGFLQTTDSPYSQLEPIAIGVAVHQNTAYLAVSGAGLYVIDISDPSRPTLLSVFNEPMPLAYGKKNETINVMDVVVQPPYAYILDQNAVRIVDVSDSENPKGLGIFALPTIPFNNGGGASRSLAIEGNKLFVVDNAAGLLVLDVTDPSAPTLDSELHLPGIASWVVVENETIYVAAGEGGLFIIRYDQDSSTTETSSVTTKPSVSSAVLPMKTIEANFTPYQEANSPLNTILGTGKTIIVNNVLDSGSGTLRESLESVSPGDIITFDPEVFPPANPATIQIKSQLPGIDQGGVTLDASNAGVILDGSDAPSGTAGLSIGSNNNAIKGFQILNFLGDGIKLSGSNNLIGGDRDIGTGLMGEGNLVSGNRDFGISICCVERAVHNTIVGNYVGTDVTGTQPQPNAVGIVVGGWKNTIGGDNPADRNVISANTNADIELKGAAENLIIGNYIGLDSNGSSQIRKVTGFSVSIWLKSTNNRVERNVIAGTLGFVDTGTSYNEVVGNYFGTDATGMVSLNSDAYVVITQPYNRIGGTNPGEGNLINGRIGIARSSNTYVFGNSINTDLTGKTVFPRPGGWEVGLTEGSCYNFIGGTTETEKNVINGGTESVLVHLETYSNFNFIMGNAIGTDATNAMIFPNHTGIGIENAESNFIQGNRVTGGMNGISLALSEYDKPGANFNIVKMNEISDIAKYAIGIGRGEGNMILGNTFSNNNMNGYDAGVNNTWEDGVLGN